VIVGGEHLWRGICNCRANYVSVDQDKETLIDYIESAIQKLDFKEPRDEIIAFWPALPSRSSCAKTYRWATYLGRKEICYAFSSLA
jgi:hypothetical protein